MKASIVMATYNGQKYVTEQIESILLQMKNGDELIISDDGSTDDTISIVKKFAEQNSCIRFVNGPHKGYIENFQYLLSLTNNDIILITDQDDVWMPTKLSMVRNAFIENSDKWVLLHNATFINECGKHLPGTMFEQRKAKHGFWHNLLKSAYYGCCMALTKEFKDFIVPFPLCSLSYDQWIGLYGEMCKKTVFLDAPLIMHRIHGNNESFKRGTLYRIKFRLVMCQYMLLLSKRCKEN